MTTYPLSEEDRAIQQRARNFVDGQLIPWEEHAEANGGQWRKAVADSGVDGDFYIWEKVGQTFQFIDTGLNAAIGERLRRVRPRSVATRATARAGAAAIRAATPRRT